MHNAARARARAALWYRGLGGNGAVQITAARTNDVTVFSTPGMAAISFHT